MNLDPLFVGFLVFARVAGLLMTLPGMSASTLPSTGRLALALPLSIVLYPAAGNAPAPASLLALMASTTTEAIVGVAMGLSVSLLVGALGMAGEIISSSIGLNVGAMLDPITGTQQGALGTLANTLGTAVFLVTGTHLQCILALGESFHTLPVGACHAPFAAGEVLAQLAVTVFATSAQLAGPIMGMMLMVNLTLLVIGRMAPNLQLFFAIGTTVTVVVGLAVLLAALPSLLSAYAHAISTAPHWMLVIARQSGGESDQEKTEDASERQIERFRKEGKVVQSKELTAAFSMCGAVLALLFAGPLFAEGLTNIWYAARTHALDADMGVAAIEAIAMVTAFSLGPPILLVLTAAAACSLITGVVITGFNVSTDALEPKWARLDVLAAAKQTWFSTQPLIAMVKGLLVASCVIWAAWGSVVEHIDALPVLAASPLPSQVGFVASLLGDFTRRVLPVVIAIGAGDYAYQWWKLNEDMKMDKQAVKDEHKESEGDPHIRGKRKQRQRQLALGNMLAKVQLADVVITNPTHYAIALRYRKEENAAPIVVARGVDHLALKIRAEAARQEIPIIENRPLARALYAKARAGHPIPQAFYGPVAQVLAVVLKRRRKLLKAS